MKGGPEMAKIAVVIVTQTVEVADDFDPELLRLSVATRLNPDHPFWHTAAPQEGAVGIPQVHVHIGGRA